MGQKEHSSTVLEPSISFSTLVKIVDVGNFWNEITCTLHIPLGRKNVLSHQEHHSLFSVVYDSDPEVTFTHKNNPDIKFQLQFRKYCSYSHKSNHMVSNCLREKRKDKQRKQLCFSRSKSLVEKLIENFRAKQNWNHPNEQPSYPVNFCSRNSYDSRNRSNSRNRLPPYRYPQFRSLSI